jgi:hypothetical protein
MTLDEQADEAQHAFLRRAVHAEEQAEFRGRVTEDDDDGDAAHPNHQIARGIVRDRKQPQLRRGCAEGYAGSSAHDADHNVSVDDREDGRAERARFRERCARHQGRNAPES